MSVPSYLHQKKEVDLIELIGVFYKYKYTVFISIAVSLLFGLVYISFRTPIYKAEVIISEPLKSQIIELEIENIYKVTAEDVFLSLKNALKNNKYLLEFYTINESVFNGYKIDSENNIEFELIKIARKWKLINEVDNNNEPNRIVNYIIKYPKGVEGHILLNNYINFVANKEREIVIDEFDKMLEVEIDKISGKIKSNKIAYDIKKQLNMGHLSEAIIIAKKIGIDKPYFLNNKSEVGTGNILKAEINNNNPLYYRGYDALEAEKKVLMERKNEKKFFPKIIELESKLSLLKNKKINTDKIQVVNWIQKAYRSNEELQPNKITLILLFVGVGVIIGLFIVLVKFMIVIEKTKNR
ncbi:Wzz/FepE/Etk N-terminal domain-containing protein [Spartinivicinus poritis]|uniref:Wzz/FepE/Etk N-terminal domain-containing protein n=1 Tax=Spartinivicinus poritis TaxID=2994640 RepID=A0ABT5U7D8_9GAMM|nr:Wzz/FepE/Etk N-terminal domain-containing protein [Spartinivicinus sp. A2-2]MDE1462291.1 Wzz/FepE/Etk N-terminal domain-containing protein [Spartinivicinus sp. A2-2]